MDGDIVALLVNFVHAGDMLHVPVQHPGGVHRYVGVVAVDLHAQGRGRVGHLGSDGAQTDDAQLLALDLAACEGFFALLRGLGNVLIVRVAPAPLDAPDQIPGSDQHAGKHHLLHAVGIRSGGVEHHDALLGAGVQRNVVDSGSGSGHGQQTLRQLHFMHIRAAHQNALRLPNAVGHHIVLGQAVCAALGNIVQAMDLFHNLLSSFNTGTAPRPAGRNSLSFPKLFYLPYLVSKSSINSTSFFTPSMGIAL